MPIQPGRRLGAVTRFAALVATAVVLLGGLFGAAAAHASQGSVPTEVATFATDPKGLRASLTDLFGVGAGGKGTTFDDTTKVGQVNRVFTWTAPFLAGTATDTPLLWQNTWSAPVTVGGTPIGLAIIWINPQTVRPGLADFVTNSMVAYALADIPADVYLIHDEPRGAWFTLSGTSLTPIVEGSSGVASKVELAAYQAVLRGRAPATPAGEATTSQGTINSVVIVGVVVLGIILVLLLAGRRSRKATQLADAAAPVPPPTEVLAPLPAEPSLPAPAPAAPAKPKRPAKPPVAAVAPAPRPAAAKTSQPAKPRVAAAAKAPTPAKPRTAAAAKAPTAAKPQPAAAKTSQSAKPRTTPARKPAASRVPRTPLPPESA